MTTQGPRPIRLAGFALIGVAVVAVGLGVFALTSSGSGSAQAGRPPVTGTPPPPASTTPTTTTSKPPTTTPPTTTKGKPPATTTPPPGLTTTVVPPPTTPAGGPGATLVQTVPLRVYNNSKIKNLAQTAAADFRAAGFNVVEVGNYSQGIIPTSTVYYSSAPGEQQVATELAHQFNMKVAPRFAGIAYASPGVIAIITKDFSTGK
jgi:hypothetical protein